MTLSEIQTAADTAFFKYKEAKLAAETAFLNVNLAQSDTAFSTFADYSAACDAADAAYALASKQAAQAAFELSRAKRRQTVNA
jgi:hypothetical protein